MTRPSDSGQVLALFALSLVVVLGFAALAIDVSNVFSTQRQERSLADAAALAGVQDAYRAGSRAVDNTEWTRARTNAMQTLVSQLTPGAPLPTCGSQDAPYAADLTNCLIPGSPYYVSVRVPAPSCASGGCDPVRSVQVTVRQPRLSLTFARLFGQSEWDLAVTSVAERALGRSYVFAALRPPKPSNANRPQCAPNCDANEDNISLSGQDTRLVVMGDMATNTNLVLNGGAMVLLDPGSTVDRFDQYRAWSGPPPDNRIATPVEDPGYAYPARPGAQAVRRNDQQATLSEPACRDEVARVPAAYGVTVESVDEGRTLCYEPGIYTYRLTGPPQVETLLFTPGVYFFDRGIQPGNNVRVIGGYEPGAPGVAFVFPVSCNPTCDFAGNAASIFLNAGSAYPSGTGTTATAAVNWNGARVETNETSPSLITLLVARDPDCYVATTEPAGCRAGSRSQLKLPGGGQVFLLGVTYAPTDNVEVLGRVSGSEGRLGQIWAWTFKYSGNTRVLMSGAVSTGPGVIRLATPCSPGSPCTNPEAAAPIP